MIHYPKALGESLTEPELGLELLLLALVSDRVELPSPLEVITGRSGTMDLLLLSRKDVSSSWKHNGLVFFVSN
jgi:hypothetical protein